MSSAPGSSGILQPSDSGDLGTHGSAELRAVPSTPTAYSSACTVWTCEFYAPYGSLADATLSPLFTRSANGVTVRAFTALWSLAPVELAPVASGSGSASASGSGPRSSPAIGTETTVPTKTPGPPTGTTVPVTIVPGGTATTGTATTVPVTTVPVTTVPVTTVPHTIPDGTTTTTLVTGTGTPVPNGPIAPISCEITHALVVEASDSGAVGVVVVPLGASISQPINVLSDEVVGASEGAPMEIVVAHTDVAAAAVRAVFANGDQDQMNVVGQWAVLVDAQEAPGSTGGEGSGSIQSGASVYALAADGTVLEQAAVPGSGALALPIGACLGFAPGSAASPPAGTSTSRTGSANKSSKQAGGNSR